MPRIRSIKPEIANDAKLASVSRDTRYHFVLLWTVADDEGFFRAVPRLLLGQLYPHDADVDEERVISMNTALAKIELLEFRPTRDGVVGCVVNWTKHQKIDRPSKSHIRESFASVARGVIDTFDAGVLSPESRVLSPDQSNGAAAGGRSKSAERTCSQPPPALPSTDVTLVIDHFRSVHPRRRPSVKDAAIVRRALTLGYAARDLCDAIDGNKADAWHAEKHKHELAYVLRDAGKIDQFREMAIAAKAPLVDEHGFATERAADILSGAIR